MCTITKKFKQWLLLYQRKRKFKGISNSITTFISRDDFKSYKIPEGRFNQTANSVFMKAAIHLSFLFIMA